MSKDRRLTQQERRFVYEIAIEENGKVEQLGVLIEELSELQKEICKMVFRNSGNLNHVAEEAADVTIMLEQLEVMFPKIHDAILEHKDRKVRRLAHNLKLEV